MRVTIDDELAKRLRLAAVMDDKSIKALVESLIRENCPPVEAQVKLTNVATRNCHELETADD